MGGIVERKVLAEARVDDAIAAAISGGVGVLVGAWCRDKGRGGQRTLELVEMEGGRG